MDKNNPENVDFFVNGKANTVSRIDPVRMIMQDVIDRTLPFLRGFLIAGLLVPGVLFISCEKKGDPGETPPDSRTLDQLVIESTFDWSTTREVNITIKATDPDDHPVQNVRFTAYSAGPGPEGEYLFSGVTNEDGLWETTQNVPSYVYELTFSTGFSGSTTERKIEIVGEFLTGEFEDLVPDTSLINHDHDIDGIADAFDDYPFDTIRAFNNWYPSERSFGTIVFEDSWPQKGDYDFNDLVVNYRFNQVTNFQNHVVEIRAMIVTEAAGSGRHNALAFEMPVNPGLIKNISGNDLRHGYFTVVDSNGVESGIDTSHTVVIVYDDVQDRFPGADFTTGVNTEPGSPDFIPDTIRLTIEFNWPVPLLTIGVPPYNPFIVADINKGRTREIHLVNNAPTPLADPSFFRTLDDASIPSDFKYYRSKANLPWAISFLSSLSYLSEKHPVNSGYLFFNTWAESSGYIYRDWYENVAPGYRNQSVLYPRP